MKWLANQFERIARFADRHSPQTLFARALIIIVVPMLLLQALSAWWFYSQRGDNVTNRLAILRYALAAQVGARRPTHDLPTVEGRDRVLGVQPRLVQRPTLIRIYQHEVRVCADSECALTRV